MGFFDLFRPAWKHSDPEVRLDSVRQLDETQTDILLQVARKDTDDRIRRVAIKKINDPALLQELAQADTDESVRKAATDKARFLWLDRALTDPQPENCLQALNQLQQEADWVEVVCSSMHATVRQEAFHRLTNVKMFADVLKKATDRTLRKSALEKISDAGMLRDTILSLSDKELAQQAFQKIDQATVLLDLAKRGPKWLRETARQRASLFESTVSTKQTGSRAEWLGKACRLAEEAVVTKNWDEAVEKMGQAKQIWVELATKTQEEAVFERRFEKATSQLELRRSAIAERLKQEAAQEQQARLRILLCEQAEQAKEFTDIKEAERAWAALGPVLYQLSNLSDRFLTACASFQRVTRKPDAPEPKVAPTKTADLEKAHQAHLDGLHEIAQRLQNNLDQASRKQVEERLKEWDEAVENIEALPKAKQAEVRNQFRKVREALLIRLEECKQIAEWKTWAAYNELEQLRLKTDALQTETDRSKFLKTFAEIRLAWQRLKRVPGDKAAETKNRIQTAYETLATQHKSHIHALQQERKGNLQKKKELLALAVEWSASADFALATPKMKELQAAWQAVGPVPKEQAQALVKQFRQSLRDFYNRLREHRKKQKGDQQARIQQKEALCTQAEALSHSTDWKKTASLFKDLQAQWKLAGSLPKSHAEALWVRFQAACNHFFQARKAHFAQAHAEKQQNLEQKESICNHLEALLEKPSESSDDPYEQLTSLRTQWKTIGPVPSTEGGLLEDHFTSLCQRFFNRSQSKLSKEQKAELSKELSRFENRIVLPESVSEKTFSA